MVVNSQLVYAIGRVTIAFVWLYHGLVPKLLGPHRDELAMNMALGFSPGDAHRLSLAAGVVEVVFGVVVLVCWRQRWPLWASNVAMMALLIFTAIVQPSLMSGAFNPVTTNLCVFALGVITLELHRQTAG